MTPEIQKAIQDLQDQIDALKSAASNVDSENGLTYTQKLRMNNALIGTFSYYVALTSGGAVTTKLTFKDGILTSVS